LDRFAKAPEVGELLIHKRKSVIFSCRRRQDGGDWDGAEEGYVAEYRQVLERHIHYRKRNEKS
jgi:3-dehydroquinate dehydratase